MKVKYLDGSDIDKEWLISSSSQSTYSNEYNGQISLVKVEKVSNTISVDYDVSNKVLVDNGYSRFCYLQEINTGV